jgi:LysR family transcriptional regulator, carnitine catabolism transcriptional activator
MDLRRLRLFLAVVDEGGFTAAAKAVHVAQPAVSLAVRELEQELGAPLLVRSRRGAALTPAGEALVGPARQALRDVDTAAAAVAAVTGLVAGRLDLASLPTLAADPVAELVGRFHRAHPGVRVRMADPDDSEAVAAAVRSGESEVGITDEGAANAGLVEHPLLVQALLAVSPPGTGGRSGRDRPFRLRRLEGTALVLSPPGSSLRTVVEAAAAEAGVTPSIAVETAQREALIPLVLAGAGTTFLPPTPARTAERLGAVVQRTQPALRRTIVLVHRPGPLGPAAGAFLAIAGLD